MIRRGALFVLSAMLSLSCFAAPKFAVEGVTRRPTLSATPEDLARARERVKKDPVARRWYDDLTSGARQWDKMTPEWVRSVVPAPGAAFAYGFTGCPICGSDTRTGYDWWSHNASLDNPGHVVCKSGHVLPDKDHPDTGTGYIATDKRIHYFVGSYNTHLVETLSFRIAEPYALMYALSGDERAGRMAVVILDELARIYPTCDIGSWDYPSDHNKGRFNRPFYQVARTLVRYAEMYDYLFDHPAMQEPSSVAGLTRRQNIEKNMLLNGAEFCWDRAVEQGGLSNGQADYVRGVLGIGVVLGIPEYVKFGTDGPSGIRTLLANNIDRDGRYYETSFNYGIHSRLLYLTFAEPLRNYRGSFLAEGLNLYDDPKMQGALTLPVLAENCMGHTPTYGDVPPNWKQASAPYVPKPLWEGMFSDYLSVRSSDPDVRRQHAGILKYAAAFDPGFFEENPAAAKWHAIFGSPADDSTSPAGMGKLEKWLHGSYVFGQKGIATLRQGEGAGAQVAMLRYGPSLTHGHLDDLNVNYYSNGYDLTYDLGYKLASTHTQVGLARQTVSHNTVVVDEQSQGGGMGGGSLLCFADLPGLSLVEASSLVYQHKGVSEYRRLVALTPEYAVDVFRVRGGKKHDLPFHSLTTEVQFSGLELGPEQKGSLAGADKNWVDLQLNDGDMKGYPNKPYWNPPPGNGYGFLGHPRYAKAAGPWRASWSLDDGDGTRFELIGLDSGATSVACAISPGLYPDHPKAGHVVRRREGKDLSSCFVSVWQTMTRERPAQVVSAELATSGSLDSQSPVALVVTLRNGDKDVWLIGSSADSEVSVTLPEGKAKWKGRLACATLRNGRMEKLRLVNGTNWDGFGEQRALPSAAFESSVTRPGKEKPVLEMADPAPAGSSYEGCQMLISRPTYTRNSAYTVHSAKGNRIETAQSDMLIGVGTVDETSGSQMITTLIPHEYARTAYSGKVTSSGFFEGKRLRAADGSASTTIRRMIFAKPAMRIEVDSTEGFRKGQRFVYDDVQEGDRIEIQHMAALTRNGYKWNVAGNAVPIIGKGERR